VTDKKKYHAFISYSHKDKLYATAIQKSIETLGLPFYKSWQPDVNIFRDERKIPLAGSLTEKIITGLKESEYLIVIASKYSATSTWVKEEILIWHEENKDNDGYITNFNFILVDDVIEWDYLNHDFDKLKTTALPSFDKRIFKELPIWANLQLYCKGGKVQSNNSNYEWEVAKIKGLLLNKKPDEIIDEVSKGKRLFRIVTGVIIAALLLLSGFAFYQRNNAIVQKEIAQNEAKKQKGLYLLSEASKLEKIDPTQALRLLITADSLYPNNTGILQNIYSIYKNLALNPFYQKDIYTELLAPVFELSSDNKYFLLYNSPDDNKDRSKAFLTDIDGNVASIISYSNKEIEKISFIPNSDKILALLDNYSSNDTLESEIKNVIIITNYESTLQNKFEFKNAVESFAISNDGKTFITSEETKADEDNSKHYIVIRDISSGSEMKKYEVGEGGADNFQWHPKENKLLFSTYDSIISLNLTNGTRTSKKFKSCHNVSYSPNGEYFIGASSDEKKAILWTIDGKFIADLPHSEYVWSATFSEQSNLIVTSSWDDTVKIWGIDGKLHKSINNKARTWYSYFNKEADKFFTISKDRAGVSVYDTSGNLLTTMENGKGIENFIFSENQKQIITSTTNHLKFWNTTPNEVSFQKGRWYWKESSVININGKELTIKNENDLITKIFSNYIFAVERKNNKFVVFTGTTHFTERNSNTGRLNKTAIDTSIIYVIDNKQNIQANTIVGFSIQSVVCSNSSNSFLTTCSDGKARLLDTKFNVVAVFESRLPFHNEIDEITHTEFSKNGDTILSFTAVGYLIMFDIHGNKLKLFDFSIDKKNLPTKNSVTKRYGSFCNSRDGNLIATFPGESHALIFNRLTQKVDTLYYNKEGDIHSLIRNGKFVENGKYLITQNDYGLDIWNLKQRERLVHIKCDPIDFDISEDEKSILINASKENSFIFLLPEGIKEWLKKVSLAPLISENKNKYEL
jgi:WD40 repeat protein